MPRKRTTKAAPQQIDFFKYDPVADQNDTFNIEKALNENWDKAKAEFERQATEDIRLDGQIDDLEVVSHIARGNVRAISTDLNDIKKEGNYLVEGADVLNQPPNLTTWGTLIVSLGGTGAVIQEFIQQYHGNNFFRDFNGATWSKWRRLATTERTEILLKNNWVRHIGGLTVSKTGNIVSFNMLLKDGIINDGTIVFTVTNNCIPTYNTQPIKVSYAGVDNVYHEAMGLVRYGTGNVEIIGVKDSNRILISDSYSIEG